MAINLARADNHISQPRTLPLDRFPAHLKDKAPSVMAGKDCGGIRFDTA